MIYIDILSCPKQRMYLNFILRSRDYSWITSTKQYCIFFEFISLVIIVVKYCQVIVIIGVLQDGKPLGIPSDSVQLRYGCGWILWLMVDFAIVNRVYKPTFISKAPSYNYNGYAPITINMWDNSQSYGNIMDC